MRTRSSLAVLLCLLFVVGSTAQLTEVPPSSTSWSISELSTVYSAYNDTTTFTYSISTGATEIGPFILLTGCASPGAIISANWAPYVEPNTGLSGLRYALGQAANTVHTYSISFYGAVYVNISGSAFLQESTTYAIFTGLPVPDCAGTDPVGLCNAPSSLVVSCSDSAALAPPTTTANFYQQRRISGSCPDSFSVLNVFRQSSGPSNTFTECVQTITVEDTEAPVPNLSDTFIRIGCNDSIPPVPVVNFTDNCDSSPTVDFCEERKNGSCAPEFFITRTWTATDNCGNSRCVTQTIARVATPPVLSSPPPNLVLNCANQTIPPAPTLTADDFGCGCLSAVQGPFETRYPGDCPAEYEIVRVWNASDCCGNVVSAQQTISVIDTQPPVISPLANQTIPCNASALISPASATDACGGQTNTSVSRARLNFSTCPATYILEDTHSVCDSCGNTATSTSYIMVTNPYPPVFNRSSLPANTSVLCGQVPPPATVTASHPCLSVTITMSQRTIPGPCPSTYTILRTWSALDQCGASVNYTQAINVIDNTIPLLDNSSIPNLGPYQCASQVPSFSSILSSVRTLPSTAPASCPQLNNITGTETRVNGSCPNSFVLFLDFYATNCLGNSDHIRTNITVRDTTPPTLHGVPPNMTASCLSIPAAATVTATDNCDLSVPVTMSNSTIPGSCPGVYTIVRVWRAVDSCGNAASASQFIFVNNTFPPQFTSSLSDITVTCDNITAPPVLTANSSCAEASVALISQTRINGSCLNQYTLVRTWQATDTCGLTNSITQRVFVTDVTPPTFQSGPSDINATCLDIPAPGPVCAFDSCNGLTVTFSETTSSGPCVNGVLYTILRTWIATDACGLTATYTARVFVQSAGPPSMTALPPVTMTCNNVSTLSTMPSATSQCLNVSVSSTSSRIAGSCPLVYSILRTFTALDTCGASVNDTQLVTVTNPFAPTLTIPADILNASCIEPSIGPASATHPCDLNPTVTGPVQTRTNGSCAYDYELLRTWTACDSCGNCVNKTQRIVVGVSAGPSFTSALPNSTTAQCTAPTAPTLFAVDACGNPVNVVFTSTSNGRCPTTITNTWTATDICGRSISHVQIVTVSDTLPPTLSGNFSTITSQCSAPPPPAICGSDTCPGLNATYRETRSNVLCNYSYDITRLWTLTDACGNVATATQLVHVRDSVGPVFSRAGRNVTFSCTLGPITPPTVTDSCDSSPVLTNVTTRSSSGSCYNLTIVYTARDVCGNIATLTDHYSVVDTLPPTGTPLPNSTVTCGIIPPFPSNDLSAQCGVTVSRLPDVYSNTSCPYRFNVTRGVTAVTPCGNRLTLTQLIQSVHTIPPTLYGVPANTTVNCTTTVPVATVVARDSCGNNVSVVFSDRFVNGSCEGDFYEFRLWTATDACGLVTSALQIIHYVNPFAPGILPLAPILSINQCVAPIAPSPNISTYCAASYSLHVVNSTIPGACPQLSNTTLTYIVTDACGNSASVAQAIISGTTIPPTLLNLPPALITAPCYAIPAPPVVTAVSSCGAPLNVSFSQTRINGSCANVYNLSRVWSTVDQCGLTASFTQIVVITDTFPPSITAPPNLRVLCGFVPCPANVTATDSCPGVTINFLEIVHMGSSCCDYVLERQWIAVDACGLTATAIQNITVSINIPPVLTIPPNECIPCQNFTGVLPPANATAYQPPLAIGTCVNPTPSTDRCSTEPAPSGAVALSFNSASYSLTFSSSSILLYYQDGEAKLQATLSDSQGNTFSLVALLYGGVPLSSLSSYSPPLTLNSSCYSTAYNPQDPSLVSPSTWTFYNRVNGSITGPNGVSIPLSATAGRYSQIGVGANGINAQFGALLFLSYTSSSGVQSLVLPLDVRAQGPTCVIDSSLLPELTCNVSLPINVTVVELPGACPSTPTFNRTFCITDYFNSSRVICDSQTICITNNNLPVISGNLGSLVLECGTAIPPPDASASTLCDNNTLLNVTEVKIPGGCPSNYTLLRTYLARDHCGHSSTAQQTITVQDTIPPVLTGIPTSTQTYFCTPPALPAINATDNCGIDYTQWPKITQQRLAPNISGIPSCPQNYILRTYVSAMDLCGHLTSQYFDELIVNNQPPTLSGVPSNLNLRCNDTIPSYNVTALSACQGSLPVSFHQTFTPSTCGQYSIINTWSTVDACGQTASASQTITISNPFPPTFTGVMPQNLTISCSQALPPAAPLGSSVCGNSSITLITTRVNGSCANDYTIFRTWTLSDCLGRSVSYVQMIQVTDTTPPSITPAYPPVVNASCLDVPMPPAVCANTACPGLDVEFTESRSILQPNPNPLTCARYQLTRTWLAISACGLTNSTQQIVNVFDTTPPTCSPALPPSDVSCLNQTVPPPPTCSDDCSNVTITLFTHSAPGPQNCSISQINYYSYLACDACDNCVWVNTSQTVLITTPPVVGIVSQNFTLQCNTAPIVPPANASDQCFQNIQPISTSNFTAGQCTGTGLQQLTYIALNPCGLAAIPAVITIAYVDTIAPIFTGSLPQNTTVPCNAIPPVPILTASDNCGGAVSIVFSTANLTGSCPNSYTILRRWVATDCSGNSVSYVQSIIVTDTIAPTLTFSPPLTNLSVPCTAVPPAPTPLANDSCPGFTLTSSQTRRNLSNPLCADYLLTRQWLVTDACGNLASALQTVNVSDTVPPSCPSPPAPRTLSCLNASLAIATPPSCTDACSGVIYTPLTITTPGRCAPEFTRTFAWRVSDNCGNYVWYNQTFIITDVLPPIFSSIPPVIYAACNAVPAPVAPIATDQCTAVNVTFTEFNNSQPNTCQNYTITRVWTAIDSCGNTASTSQLVIVSQTQPPVWTSVLPTNLTMECALNYTAPTLTATTACGPVIVTPQSTLISSSVCTQVYRYDWVATTLCGQSISHTIYVTITDTVPPVLTPPAGFSPVITQLCNETSLPPSICCSDNCNGLTANFNETRVPGSCPLQYDLLRSWQCVDHCGNVATLTQTVHVVDLIPPVFNAPLPPTTITEECRDTSVAPTLTATGSCGPATVNLTTNTISGQCSANFTLIRSYTATDECGLTAHFNQTVTVRESTPPYTNATTPLCFYSATTLDRLVIRNLTVPNTFFPAGDVCTAVRIAFVNCTSDEDSSLGSGCTYYPGNDTLYVSPMTNGSVAGRLYTVNALVINACGLSVPTSRQIFVPFNRTSISIRGFPFSPEECVPIVPVCPQNCACQTVNHECSASSSYGASLSLTSSTPDLTAGTTTFTYTLNLGSGSAAPNRILIGIDLTQYQILSFSPTTNVTFGAQPGTFVKGIAWNNVVGRTFTFTINGALQSSALVTANVPYVLGGLVPGQDSAPTSCSGVQYITGPSRNLSPTFRSGASSLTGYVYIDGARFGSDRTARIPVHDAAVALENSLGQIVALTLTGTNGAYTFNNLPSSTTNYTLNLLQYGILQPALRSSGNFLRSTQYDILGVNPITGPPQSLANPNFFLLLDDQQQPVYNRPLGYNSFEGDSEPLSWWQYEASGLGELPDYLSQSTLNSYLSTAQSFFASSSCSASLTAPNTLESNLYAAVLNNAAGYGFFEPYRQLQGWFIAYAQHVYCAGISSASDQTIALRFVEEINGASDINTIFSTTP